MGAILNRHILMAKFFRDAYDVATCQPNHNLEFQWIPYLSGCRLHTPQIHLSCFGTTGNWTKQMTKCWWFLDFCLDLPKSRTDWSCLWMSPTSSFASSGRATVGLTPRWMTIPGFSTVPVFGSVSLAFIWSSNWFQPGNLSTPTDQKKTPSRSLPWISSRLKPSEEDKNNGFNRFSKTCVCKLVNLHQHLTVQLKLRAIRKAANPQGPHLWTEGSSLPAWGRCDSIPNSLHNQWTLTTLDAKQFI